MSKKTPARNLTETKILCYIFGMSKRFIKIFIFSMIFLPFRFQVFALNQKDEAKNSAQTQKKAEVKETLKIDFRFNTKTQDKKNCLKWKTSSKKVKDSYDALSGASVSHSTGELLSVFRDGNSKNLLAPKGLRALLLFAVSNSEYLESDNFMAEKDSNGKIKISFTHRKIGYFIQTDEKGKLDLENGFFIANEDEKQNTDFTENTDNTEDLRNDSERKRKVSGENKNELSQNEKNVNDGNQGTNDTKIMKNTDFTDNTESTEDSEKLEFSAPEGFYSDQPNVKKNGGPNSDKKFEGKLSVKLNDGILKISGKLNLVEYLEKESGEISENIGKN